MLSSSPIILNNLQLQYTHVLIDEFQDTSTVQFSLLSILASHGRITAVGRSNYFLDYIILYSVYMVYFHYSIMYSEQFH